jgi:hypothetical protein
MAPPAAQAEAPQTLEGSDAHADDSYCALCRRCQMRKKLERRLQAKKDAPPQDVAGAAPASAAAVAPHAGLARVEAAPAYAASVDELLLYIGGDGGSAGRGRRKRRAKGRTAAAAGAAGDPPTKALQQEDDEDDEDDEDEEDDDEYEGDEGGDGVGQGVAADGDRRASVRCRTNAHCGGALHSPVSDDAWGGCCGGRGDCGAGDEAMTLEEQAAIDREVEAFRLSLEAVVEARGPRQARCSAHSGFV